jgi:hypothetical protein
VFDSLIRDLATAGSVQSPVVDRMDMLRAALGGFADFFIAHNGFHRIGVSTSCAHAESVTHQFDPRTRIPTGSAPGTPAQARRCS